MKTRAGISVIHGCLSLSLLLLCSFLAGCSHSYYAPNAQQVPLFTEKHQVQITGYAGGGDIIKSNDLHVAASLTDHFAITGSGNWISSTNDVNSSNQMYGRYGEFALGYFQKIDRLGVFEIYGGTGSSFQHHDYDSAQTSDLRYTKYFIQPVIGLKKAHFEGGISFRISYVNFTDIINSSYTHDGMPIKTGYTFFEPAVTIRTGFSFVKFQAQWQIVSSLASNRTTFAYSGDMVNVGVQFVINAKKASPPPPTN
jgi:hypothetical protein